MLICSLIVVVSLTIATISVVVIGKAIAEDSEMSLERRSLTISSASASMVFDGKKLSDSTWELLEGVLKDGHKLDVTVTGSQGSVGVSENFFNVTVKDENGNDVTDQYDIQYKPGALNVRARSLTVTAKSHSKIYDGTPLVADGYIIESAKSLFEGDYLEVKVEGSITEVGNVDSVITEVKVYNDQGKEVTQNYNIKTNTGKLVVYEPGTLVISSASAYKDYDTLPLTDSNYEVKEGEIIPGHVLEVDVYGSQTDVGTGHNEFDVSIVDEYGTDVSYNYKVEKEYGNLVVGQQGVTISSADDDKVYDGTPLTNPGYTVTFDDPSLEGKITYDVKVTGSVVEGSGENTISEYFFYDSEGRDITDFFDVKRDPGELIVFPEDMVKETLKFTAKSEQKFYDGIELTRNEYDLEGELLPGHYADVKIDGAITDVGVAINSIAVVIRDKNNADVSAFYDIDAIPGVLKVDPVIFTITSEDDEKTYDGDPLTNSGFTVSPAEILDSFIVEAEITGSQTNPGESPNTIKSYTVKNLNGEALDQKNFEVRTVPGTLKVVQDESNILPVLVYKTYSAKKVYDGTPLENKEWKRLSGELLDGHTEDVEMNVSLTNVGTVKNSITVVIRDGEGKDVSDKYIIVDDGEDIGSLEVTIREFTIKANSDSKTYDSLPLTNSGYTLLGKDGKDALGKNHTIDVVITGSQTSAKTGANQSANTVESYVIYDENGDPVPDGNYYVIKEDGTLTVNKCELTVTAGSDSKDYDGEPLTCDDYTVSYNKGSLVSGHTLEVTVTGSQTEVGSSYNVATYVIYETGSGDPTVAENYQVNLIEGTLKVMGAVQEPDEPEPDPKPNGITIGGTSTSNKTVFKIKTKSADIVYLKMSSYGDYQYYQTADGWSSGWTTANPYLGQNLSNGESPFFVTAYALDNSGLSPKTCYYVKATTGISVLPYYVNGEIAKSSTDTTINVNPSALENEFTYYSWNESLNLRIPSANREAEALYAAEVSKNYLNIDDDTKEFMLELIANNDFGNPNDDILDTIDKVARYISNAADYNMNYNQKLNTEKNVVIAFLTDYQEGICQHYASAATLLFRALGVPARYTTGLDRKSVV